MVISSRTPEGTPNHCPICDSDIRIEPSMPSGDAPCPKCGTLLWFINDSQGTEIYKYETVVSIRNGVHSALAEVLGMEKDYATASAPPLQELLRDADSIQVVELVMALEERLDLDVPEDVLQSMHSVGELVNYIIRDER